MPGDRIKGITIEIDGDVTKLSKALASVNRDLKQNQATLRDVDKLLQGNPGNAALLEQKYKALEKSVSAAKQKLEKLNEAAAQMKLGGREGTKEWDDLQLEIAETEQKLKSCTKEMENFGSVQIQQVAAAGKKIQAVGDKVAGVGKTLTGAVTLPLAAVGAAGVKSFAEVDKTMQLANKTMGNTADEAQLLNTAMKGAAANSTFGMNDAAGAALNFARAGLTAEQAAAALAPAMNLAAGEGGNLDTVSGGLAGTINAFHGSFEEAGNYADVFAAACNNSALEIDALTSSTSIAAPVMASAGYSVKDLALYLGIMADNNIEANVGATALKSGIASLVKPTGQAAAKMEKLGLRSVDAMGKVSYAFMEADGSMKDSAEVQRILHDAFDGLSESEQIAAATAIFGKNQMSSWLALINTAPGDVDELSSALENCGGTTDEMAAAMMGGFGGSLEKLKSSIDVLSTSLGEVLAPTVQKIADFVQGLVDKFNALSPEQQEMIAQIGLIVAVLGPVLMIGGKIIAFVGKLLALAPILAKIITVVKGAFVALGAVMAANPIGLIIAAVAALIAIFVALWNNCEGFRDFWIGVWEVIKTFFLEAWTAISEAAVATWEAITEALSSAWEAISTAATDVWTAISEFFAGIWEGIRSTFETVVGAVSEFLSGAWEAISAAVTDVWTAISDFFTGIWDAISNAVTTAGDSISSFLSDTWEAISSAVTEVWEAIFGAISGKVEEIYGSISDGFNKAVDFIKGLIDQAFGWGADLIGGIIDGIKSMIDGIGNAVKGVAGKIASFLHFSRPDIGPLHEYESWMPDFMGELAAGIRRGRRVVQEAVKDVSADLVIFPPNGTPGKGGPPPAPPAAPGNPAAPAGAGAGALGGGGDVTVVLKLDETEFGRAVYRANTKQVQIVGTQLTTDPTKKGQPA